MFLSLFVSNLQRVNWTSAKTSATLRCRDCNGATLGIRHVFQMCGQRVHSWTIDPKRNLFSPCECPHCMGIAMNHLVICSCSVVGKQAVHNDITGEIGISQYFNLCSNAHHQVDSTAACAQCWIELRNSRWSCPFTSSWCWQFDAVKVAQHQTWIERWHLARLLVYRIQATKSLCLVVKALKWTCHHQLWCSKAKKVTWRKGAQLLCNLSNLYCFAVHACSTKNLRITMRTQRMQKVGKKPNRDE